VQLRQRAVFLEALEVGAVQEVFALTATAKEKPCGPGHAAEILQLPPPVLQEAPADAHELLISTLHADRNIINVLVLTRHAGEAVVCLLLHLKGATPVPGPTKTTGLLRSCGGWKAPPPRRNTCTRIHMPAIAAAARSCPEPVKQTPRLATPCRRAHLCARILQSNGIRRSKGRSQVDRDRPHVCKGIE